MSDRTGIGFGILIAYVLPGFVLLSACSLLVPALQLWLLGRAESTPSVGGVVYVTAASILLGQLLNVFRWALLDTIHEWTGISRPIWDDRRLPDRQRAFEMIVEQHYRYYQFYGNLLLALPLSLLAVRFSEFSGAVPVGALETAVLIVVTVLFFGSRDVLRRYYQRTSLLLIDEGDPMTNGNHPKPKSEKAVDSKKPQTTGASKTDAKK